MNRTSMYIRGLLLSAGLLSLPLAAAAATLNVSADVAAKANLVVTGALSKSGGTFVIDHPLNPAGELLYHSFVESPDVLNIYDGVAKLDAAGEARVVLPDYFEALNKDPQYLVRSIDAPAPNLYIKQKVVDNSFVIAGGVPHSEVSWQVTGIRHDPYILANPIIPEVEKGPNALVDKGEFLFDGYAQACGWNIGCLFSRLSRFW